MSDTDATQARQDVVADVDEIIEHVINANMLSMPYDVYSELFDAVDGLGVEIENLQAENAKLRELLQTLRSSHDKMCTQRGNCFGCAFFYEDDTACPYVKVCQSMRKLGVEVDR